MITREFSLGDVVVIVMSGRTGMVTKVKGDGRYRVMILESLVEDKPRFSTFDWDELKRALQ